MDARILLAALCLTWPVAGEPARVLTQAQKEWALGAGAMLAQIDGDRLDVLGGAENLSAEAETDRQALRRSWNITSRAELLGVLEELVRDDGDRTRVGWNYPRAINLARWGYISGYLQEDEAWNFILPAAERLQKTFSSWQELGQVYLDARAKWYSNRLAIRRQADYAYRVLLAYQGSPWRKYPWNLDLGNGYAAPPSVDKTAWLILAAHPGGLICLRVTVPDHRDALEYESAIEETVGCRPHITGQRRDGPDWVLDTECLQPDTLHGTQTVARFHLEPIAELLRRDGVTQLFAMFQHQPNGSDSELFPAASDGWIENGWRWYFTVRSLRLPLPDTTLSYGVPPEGVRVFLIGAILLAAVSLSSAFLLRRNAWWSARFPMFYWGSWLVLSVSFQGLAIAGFWSGGEALGADVRGLMGWGGLALLVRWATAIIMSAPALRSVVPDLSIGRILRMTFWGVMTEVPIAVVMVLLCDPQRPINLATLIALLGLGAAVALTAWNFRMRAEGLRGGRASAGELCDAIGAMAKRMGVPLRRIYILPEDISPRLGPKAGSHGDLLIPERLVRSAYRRELDGIIAYQLMLIKTKYLNTFWAGVLPILVILVWRIYNAQNAPSANVTLLAQAGMVMSAVATFGQSMRRIHSRAQKAFQAASGDAEGWIAGLARVARLSGTTVTPGVAEQIAERCAVPKDHLPNLVEKGFPETGIYPVPDFDRCKLVSVS
jgi:hypothetical protein